MPEVLIQRCLVHIQRMCLLWITRHPQSEAGQQLRNLVYIIHTIRTVNDKLYWIQSLLQWEKDHEMFLKQKSFKPQTARYWYTHKLLRRSFFTIKRALPNMFHYLDNPAIPKSTNGIESYFGHLKNHLDLHRGLTKNNRINFIKWYIYFKNTDQFWVFLAMRLTGNKVKSSHHWLLFIVV